MKNLFSVCALTLLTQMVFAQGYRTHQAEAKEHTTKEHTVYGKNIFSFSPVGIILTDVDQSEPDVALAFSYEYILDNELIGIKMPVSFSMINNYFYLMPTLKLYPKKQGIAKYSVGPQFLYGMGDGSYEERIYSQQTGITVTKTTDIKRKQFGFLLNNSVNFTLVKSLYVALDASLGIIYFDNQPNYVYNGWGLSPINTNNNNINPAFQLNFNMGYRF